MCDFLITVYMQFITFSAIQAEVQNRCSSNLHFWWRDQNHLSDQDGKCRMHRLSVAQFDDMDQTELVQD
jgi:hypothetical protein